MKTLVDIMDNVFLMISTSLSKSDIVSLGMNMLSYQLGIPADSRLNTVQVI